MKKPFYFGILGLILFEVTNVFFIRPMPGSPKMESLGLTYEATKSLFFLLTLPVPQTAHQATPIPPAPARTPQA